MNWLDKLMLGLLGVSLFLMFYVYGGYLYLLKFLFLIKKIFKGKKYIFEPPEEFLPRVTIYFSAYNEEENILKRVENIVNQDYPPERMEMIIISDGSTDSTLEKAKEAKRKYPERDIKVFAFENNRGRAHAQNFVYGKAKNKILIATDAETKFERNAIREIVKPFYFETVGVVGGRVIYLNKGTPVGEAYNVYRDVEHQIRFYENLLKICVKTDGPFVAYRKDMWEKIYDYEDVDQVISIFAKKKGFLTVYKETAVAYDYSPSSVKQEIKARARMTRKGLLSIFGRWKVTDMFKHPFFTFALFSHKVLRYFSPLYFCISLLTIIYFLILYKLFSVTLLGVGAIMGGLTLAYFLKIPVLRKVLPKLLSFIYANIGFTLGIYGWLKGDKEGRYTPTRQIGLSS